MNTASTLNLHNTSIPVKENKKQSFPCCSTITICLSRFLSQTRTCFHFTNKIKSPIPRFYEERKCARRVICFLFSFWTFWTTRKRTGQFSHIRSIALFSLALLMLWLLKLLSKSVQSTAYHASTSFKISSRLLQTGWECSQNVLIDIEELFLHRTQSF